MLLRIHVYVGSSQPSPKPIAFIYSFIHSFVHSTSIMRVARYERERKLSAGL